MSSVFCVVGKETKLQTGPDNPQVSRPARGRDKNQTEAKQNKSPILYFFGLLVSTGFFRDKTLCSLVLPPSRFLLVYGLHSESKPHTHHLHGSTPATFKHSMSEWRQCSIRRRKTFNGSFCF